MKIKSLRLKGEEDSLETTEEMEMAMAEEEETPGKTKFQMSQGQVKEPTLLLLWTCLSTESTVRHQETRLLHT